MKKGLFKKLITAPNYISLNPVGIEINDESIRYIEFDNDGGNLSLKNFGNIRLDKGIIKEGEISNKTALAEIISQLKNKFSTNLIRLAVPEEKTFIFNTQIPKVTDKEIKQAVEFKLEENVPFKADEVFFEYKKIENIKDKNNLYINVTVIPKKTIAEFSDFFESQKLYPISFELDSIMVAKSVIPKNDKRNYIILNIKEDLTVISYISNNVVRFTSTIQIGKNTMDEKLFQEAKNNGNINMLSQQDTSPVKDGTYLLLSVFADIKSEIEKFNEYIESVMDNKKTTLENNVHKIILCGSGSTTLGLLNYMTQELKTEVALANVWTNIFDLEQEIPKIKFNDSLDFPTSIGLAMPNNRN